MYLGGNLMEFVLMKNNQSIYRGNPESVREKVEGLLFERLGIFIPLQESIEEGVYQIYLHSSAYEELSDDDVRRLDAMKISDDPDLSTEGFKRLLNIQFKTVQTNIA